MSNPALVRMVQQVVSMLKRQYGMKITYNDSGTHAIDYKTGIQTPTSTPLKIQYGIVLPVHVAQSVIESTKKFNDSKTPSGKLLIGERVFMLAGKDLKTITPKIGDWIICKDKRYDIIKIDSLCKNVAYILKAKSQGG